MLVLVLLKHNPKSKRCAGPACISDSDCPSCPRLGQLATSTPAIVIRLPLPLPLFLPRLDRVGVRPPTAAFALRLEASDLTIEVPNTAVAVLLGLRPGEGRERHEEEDRPDDRVHRDHPDERPELREEHELREKQRARGDEGCQRAAEDAHAHLRHGEAGTAEPRRLSALVVRVHEVHGVVDRHADNDDHGHGLEDRDLPPERHHRREHREHDSDDGRDRHRRDDPVRGREHEHGVREGEGDGDPLDARLQKDRNL